MHQYSKNARCEHVELDDDKDKDNNATSASTPLTEEVFVRQVGEQNYKNKNDDKTSASINS